MAWFAAVAAVAGSVLSARQTAAAGKAEEAAGIAVQQGKEFEAQGLEQQAGQTRAASQRTAQAIRKRGRLAESTALARAAASGGGASDPTVEDVIGDLAEETEFAALTALFEGEETARGLQDEAFITRHEGEIQRFVGRTARRSASREATAGILQSGASLFGKYG